MKYKIICILAILLCSMSMAAATTATYTSDGKIKLFNDKGSWDGYILEPGLKDITVYKGAYLYAATPSGIKVYDIRVAKTPIYKKTIAPYSNCLEINGIYLYSGGKNLIIYSLGNPAAPRYANKIILISSAQSMEIYNNILYIGTMYNGVYKFKVTP